MPGRVSTEVDARLSFDTQASVERARHIIELYRRVGVPRERILIKLASTWEGIQAAKELEADGIRCNLTLLFSLAQALACAAAKAQLVSPFVGRIYDWHKKAAANNWDEAANSGTNDPGVRSVRPSTITTSPTIFPPKSWARAFATYGQIVALAGCDCSPLAPNYLANLPPIPIRCSAGSTPSGQGQCTRMDSEQ